MSRKPESSECGKPCTLLGKTFPCAEALKLEGAWCRGASTRSVCIECREGGGVCLELWLGITRGKFKFTPSEMESF